MRYNAIRSSHDARIKPAEGSSSVGHKIGVLVLSISALAAGAINMISGSPNKPKTVEGALASSVKGIKDYWNFITQNPDAYLAPERAANSPARRVDKLLCELTLTQTELITVYNDYTKAVDAGESLEDKERKLKVAILEAASGILNGANMPEDPRASRMLADCEKCIEVFERLRPMLPEICAAEIADLSPERTAIEQLREKAKRFSKLPDSSEKVGMLDSDGGESAGSIIDDFLKAHPQEKTNPDAISSADTSIAGGG